MAISSPGLGSNLDVNGIINQLMAAESQPLVALATKEAKYQSQLSALGQIKAALSSFQSAAKGLTSATDSDAFTASSSDTAVLTASADSEATKGSYSLSVFGLATAQQLVATGQSGTADAIGSGAATTVTIRFGTISGGTFDSGTGLYSGATFTANTSKSEIEISLDDTNNTLVGIQDAINELQAGVTAKIIYDGSGSPYRLTLAADNTGASNSMQIDVSGDASISALLAYDPAGTQNLSQTAAAADAAVTVDGISISSESNTLSDVAPGATFTLKDTGDATVTIDRDTSKMRSSLETLAKAYNDLNKAVAENTAFEATLQGDAAALSVQRQIRSALGAAQSGISSTYSTLSQLGLSFERSGSIAFDSSKFQSAVTASPTEVRDLVAAFGSSLGTLADNLVDDTGPINSRTDGLNRSIDDINDRREVIGRRLQRTEERLRAEFTALDTLISSLLSTSTYLQQQLANLPKPGQIQQSQ
jgi:flagellar hook-associated protein 2